MTISVAITNSANEILDSLPVAQSLERFHLEPRCRICRNDDMRTKVNDMLAVGRSYAAIVRAVEADNAALASCDRVTIDSVRNHTRRHFPVQDAAKATYRQILERRAQENRVDFVDGVATAITPMALYETVMAKGYEALVDPDTRVDVATAMIAAGRLQALLPARNSESDLARLKAQVVQIGEAVRATVPQSMWADILAKIDELEPRSIAITDGDDLDEPCEPDDFDEF
jgi:hypothetical protein